MNQQGAACGERDPVTYGDICNDIFHCSGSHLLNLCDGLTDLVNTYSLRARGDRTSLSCFSFREAMYTLAPLCAKPAAIIFPIPELPPVTRTFETQKSGKGRDGVFRCRTSFTLDIEER
jgi:hypothetical protein